MEWSDSFAAASFRLSASYFLRRQKVTKKLAPDPASPSGARNGRDQNKSPDGALTARSGLMVLVYDRPLLRSSARGDGALRKPEIAPRMAGLMPLAI